MSRSSRRAQTIALFIAAAVLSAGSCGGGSGGGGGGGGALIQVESPDDRCAALGGAFPPGFDFVPGDDSLVWVADLSPATLVPFDVSDTTPQVASGLAPFSLPFDSDGDGREEGSGTGMGGLPPLPFAPVFDDIEIVSPDLALVTASSYEEVLFFDPSVGALVEFDVSVPAAFAPSDNIFLPAPGTVASRTGLSTFACVRPPLGALDSRGDPIATSVPAAGFCGADPSYYASFTSGAAIVGDRLFVSASNLGDDQGSIDTQYLPGAVLVYDIDVDADPPTVSPNAGVPVIVTQGFNPTHVTSHETATRRFALVTVSGAIGIEPDDPGTDVVEAFGIPLTDAAIEVIDADTLELIAIIPLGAAALSSAGVVVDPTGRVGAVGSVAGRDLYAVDLEPLDAVFGPLAAPVVLDGVSGADAVIFDADAPFVIPALPDGAPAGGCPGFVADVAFRGDELYVTEACDGSLTVVGIDLSGAPPAPLDPDRFVERSQIPIAAPIRADTLDEPRQPGAVAVRPGTLNPEVFFLIGQQEGLLCGVEF